MDEPVLTDLFCLLVGNRRGVDEQDVTRRRGSGSSRIRSARTRSPWGGEPPHSLPNTISSCTKFPKILDSNQQTVEDVEKRQKIEDRLPAVPSTVPQVDTDEAYEVDRVRQNRQREEDLKTIALPS